VFSGFLSSHVLRIPRAFDTINSGKYFDLNILSAHARALRLCVSHI